jgi:hypothetical protein
MPTARQITTSRARVRRELEQSSRARDRAALKRVRANLRHARKLGGRRMHEIVLSCRHHRTINRERAKVVRAEYRAAAAIQIAAERASARASCEAKKTQARAQCANRIERASRALEIERQHQEHMRRYAKSAHRVHAKRAKAAESISESDSQVAGNIPDELAPVWRAVKNRIKGTPRISRTEAFFQWVAEHRGEVLRIADAQAQADIDELVAHEAEIRERLSSPKSYRSMTDQQLSEVPF